MKDAEVPRGIHTKTSIFDPATGAEGTRGRRRIDSPGHGTSSGKLNHAEARRRVQAAAAGWDLAGGSTRGPACVRGARERHPALRPSSPRDDRRLGRSPDQCRRPPRGRRFGGRLTMRGEGRGRVALGGDRALLHPRHAPAAHAGDKRKAARKCSGSARRRSTTADSTATPLTVTRRFARRERAHLTLITAITSDRHLASRHHRNDHRAKLKVMSHRRSKITNRRVGRCETPGASLDALGQHRPRLGLRCAGGGRSIGPRQD